MPCLSAGTHFAVSLTDNINAIISTMKVLKFGGTSVGTADALRNVKAIVEGEKSPVIVVVSALGGVTNLLLDAASRARKGDDVSGTLASIKQRHLDVIGQVVPEARQHECNAVVEQFVENLASFCSMLAINRDLSDDDVRRITDAIACHGEIMSSAIVSAMIEGAEPFYSPSVIKTRVAPAGDVLDEALTAQLIAEHLGGDSVPCRVMQGFIAQDAVTGTATTLGRGGSDFTAALVAAALDAEALEIWTDVDGFYTADPRTNPDATIIPVMTYEEAQRLCDAGAKVIYPPTIAPVARKNIPVWVKNTFNPAAAGTVIKG